MKTKISLAFSVLLAGTLIGCSSARERADNSSSNIRHALDQAGLKDVSVSADAKNGEVSLTGHVPSNDEKAQADSIAKQYANGMVVSDEVAVLPPGQESEAKSINSDLDKAIEKNLDAALIQDGLNKKVKYSVKNGVVTLTGDVRSQSTRADAARVASGVPNVTQVVNELQVRHQKATSTP